ncbi:hypothetical protein ACNPNP_13415 [Microbacterium sp. AGC85]
MEAEWEYAARGGIPSAKCPWEEGETESQHLAGRNSPSTTRSRMVT